MGFQLYLLIGVGVVVRIWLFASSVAEYFAERNELVTPLTSWKRVTEGLALHRIGVWPYIGDVYHEMPLSLLLWNYFDRTWGDMIQYLFVVIDVATALVLYRVATNVASYQLQRQVEDVKKYDVSSTKLILKTEALAWNRVYVVGAFMLNPLSIASCVAKSTAVLNNLVVALAMLFILKGNRVGSSIFIAAAAYLSMYPIMLVVPAAIFIAQKESKSTTGKFPKIQLAVISAIQTTVCTVSALGLLLFTSHSLQGSWNFLTSTYGFILTVPDLTPNIGIFWYFFTEMFEHFRLFFICVFQIHAFIYVVPLTFRLHRHPIFLMYMLIALTAVFKSYLSYADVAFYISLLPMWRHVMSYMRNNFVVSVMFAVCVGLAPVLWHLWVQAGSANANFYFAITLVICSAQIFLITDLLFAFLRHDFDLIHGIKRPIVDGKPAQIILE